LEVRGLCVLVITWQTVYKSWKLKLLQTWYKICRQRPVPISPNWWQCCKMDV